MNLPYIQEFLNYLKKQHYATSTLVAYSAGLKNLREELTRDNIDFLDLNVLFLKKYLFKLKKQKSSGTFNVYVHAIRSYFAFISKIKNTKIKFNVKEIILPIKQIKPDIKEININLLQDSLKKLRGSNDIISNRNYILINLVMITGIKISEIVKIKKSSYLRDHGIVINDITHLLNQESMEYLNNFMKKSNNKSDYLFTSFSKNYSKDKHITIRTVERILKSVFNNINYNELRSLHFKSQLNQLPKILKIETLRAYARSIRKKVIGQASLARCLLCLDTVYNF